jgi:hypothetical protein
MSKRNTQSPGPPTWCTSGSRRIIIIITCIPDEKNQEKVLPSRRAFPRRYNKPHPLLFLMIILELEISSRISFTLNSADYQPPRSQIIQAGTSISNPIDWRIYRRWYGIDDAFHWKSSIRWPRCWSESFRYSRLKVIPYYIGCCVPSDLSIHLQALSLYRYKV